MFEFKVVGLSEASVEIDRKWPTRIVSLVSRYMALEQHPDHLIIRVEDVHTEDGDDYPTQGMIDQLLAFTESLTDDDRVLVHCFAGQSRSTAAMIAILMQHGMNAEDAHHAVIENRDIALPNQLIIRLLDEQSRWSLRSIEQQLCECQAARESFHCNRRYESRRCHGCSGNRNAKHHGYV